MAWDTEGTKRKILDAAVAEFAAYGPDGTTIARIAQRAGVNKERIYYYFGDKRALFTYVLRDELAKVARAVPVEWPCVALNSQLSCSAARMLPISSPICAARR